MDRKQTAHLKTWLTGRSRRGSWLCAGGALALLPVGLAVVWLTFWIVYWVTWFGFSWLLPPSDITLKMTAGGVVAVLFVANAVMDLRSLDEWRFRRQNATEVVVYALATYSLFGRASLVGPPDARETVRFLASLLMIGPRVLTLAWRLWQRSRRLATMDIDGCAEILDVLATSDRKVSFEDLIAQFPHAATGVLFRQLLAVDGVLLRASELPGLSLEDDLRRELRPKPKKSGTS